MDGINDGVRDQLEQGAKEPFGMVLLRVRAIDGQFQEPCTERAAALACGWTNTGGGTSRFFQSAKAYGLMTQPAGLYVVTLLSKRLLVRVDLEEAAKELAIIGDTVYGILERNNWHELDREELSKKYDIRKVPDSKVRIAAYMAFRPYWMAARGGNIDELTRLLDADLAMAPAVRQRGRRRFVDGHIDSAAQGSAVPPRQVVEVVSGGISSAVSATARMPTAPPRLVRVSCTACHGAGCVYLPELVQ